MPLVTHMLNEGAHLARRQPRHRAGGHRRRRGPGHVERAAPRAGPRAGRVGTLARRAVAVAACAVLVTSLGVVPRPGTSSRPGGGPHRPVPGGGAAQVVRRLRDRHRHAPRPLRHPRPPGPDVRPGRHDPGRPRRGGGGTHRAVDRAPRRRHPAAGDPRQPGRLRPDRLHQPDDPTGAPGDRQRVRDPHRRGRLRDELARATASAATRRRRLSAGGTATYTYWIPDDPTLEGAHYLHPGAGNRQAVAHGLFGALIVEPPGSTYRNPTTGLPQRLGLGGGHHPGRRQGVPRERQDLPRDRQRGRERDACPSTSTASCCPTIDPHTDAYRPGTRAINYRSEPFMVRLDFGEDHKSTVYSSYTFGDTTNLIPRGYLGDPTKFRILHAGSEVFHVYHLHGGADRWHFNPKADPTSDYGKTGLNKTPVDVQSESARIDSQSMGPGEAFNLEIENGAGGGQQGAGEFLFHCHIAHHYFAGMWGIWRVYDTLQPDLMPLPGPDAAAAGRRLGRAPRPDDRRPGHHGPDAGRVDPSPAAPAGRDARRQRGHGRHGRPGRVGVGLDGRRSDRALSRRAGPRQEHPARRRRPCPGPTSPTSCPDTRPR